MKLLADYHVHSEYSHDSITPMERQAKQAVSIGLSELCFTDHMDYYDGSDCSRYFAELSKVKQTFSGRLVIRSGWEFGLQRHTIPDFEELYSRYGGKLDFVLLSIHEVDDLDLWGHQYQRGKSQAKYTLGYYEELLRVIQAYHDYSVLAHVDLIARYDVKLAHVDLIARYDVKHGISPYPFAKIRDIVAEILTTAINDSKGIELNTSSWRYGLTDTTPSREILELYRDLGGEILTLGSDAHSPDYVGAHFEEGREILRSLGFRSFCTFEGMSPTFHTL